MFALFGIVPGREDMMYAVQVRADTPPMSVYLLGTLLDSD